MVIAIIGILATIATISLSNTRGKARDAKRLADVKQMQTALEIYFNDNQRYPDLSIWASKTLASTTPNGTTTYMAIIPDAPTPPDGICDTVNNQFSYAVSASGGSYQINYCLGGMVGDTPGGLHHASPDGLDVSVQVLP